MSRNVFGRVLDNAILFCPVQTGSAIDPITQIEKPVVTVREVRAYIKKSSNDPRNDIDRTQPQNSPGQRVTGQWCEDMPLLATDTVNAIVSGERGQLTLEATFVSAGIHKFGLKKLTGKPIRGTWEPGAWVN
jgi:hypothetical protein